MDIADQTRYARHLSTRMDARASIVHELLLPMLLFAALGGLAWAIRGTAGWAPIDGTVVPGLAWGVLWYYLCHRKGIDARGVVLWLGMGIALGGQLGYGRYVSWIQGNFPVGGEVLSVSPWAGAVWFFICGIGWGAPGGIMLGWALDGQASVRRWAVRVILTLLLLVILFNLGDMFFGEGIVSRVGRMIRHTAPGFLYPAADQVSYAGELDSHLGSTVYLNTQNFLVVLWWAICMAIAAFKRERATLVAGGVIGGLFGFGFLISALWVFGYTYAPGYTDWWKVWEVHSGINLGILYAIVLYWAIRQVDKRPAAPTPTMSEWRITAFWAAAGFVLVYVSGVQYYFSSLVPVAVLYPLALLGAMWLPGIPHDARERRLGVTLAYSAFLLVYILAHGSSKTAGVVLELYTLAEASGYKWPAGRIAIFLPVALVLVAGWLAGTWRMLRAPYPPGLPEPGATRLPERIVDLCTFTGIVGALTIWPEGLHKLGPLYAICVFFAVFAATRINSRFDHIDRST